MPTPARLGVSVNVSWAMLPSRLGRAVCSHHYVEATWSGGPPSANAGEPLAADTPGEPFPPVKLRRRDDGKTQNEARSGALL